MRASGSSIFLLLLNVPLMTREGGGGAGEGSLKDDDGRPHFGSISGQQTRPDSPLLDEFVGSQD